jgi:hypothetical protein
MRSLLRLRRTGPLPDIDPSDHAERYVHIDRCIPTERSIIP